MGIENESKKKNRIIVTLLLLIIFLCIYIYLSKGQIGNIDTIDASPVEENDIEQVETIDRIKGTESVKEETSFNKEGIIKEEKDEDDITVDSDSDPDSEEVDIEDDVKSKPVGTVKFGLTISQRSQIWSKYKKRQIEIQAEASNLNDDRFSKTYLSHVNRELKKLNYKLSKEYKINEGELEYIINEGKNGKFNDLIQTF